MNWAANIARSCCFYSSVHMNHSKFSYGHSILHFLPENYLPLGWGSWNLQLLVSLRYRCYKTNIIKIGLVVREKMLTDDGRRRTTTHSKRSPELLKWPKNRMSFMFNVFKLLFIYSMDNLYPSFDFSKNPKTASFWNNNTKQSIYLKI